MCLSCLQQTCSAQTCCASLEKSTTSPTTHPLIKVQKLPHITLFDKMKSKEGEFKKLEDEISTLHERDPTPLQVAAEAIYDVMCRDKYWNEFIRTSGSFENGCSGWADWSSSIQVLITERGTIMT